MSAACTFPLATPQRVIVRVHGHSSNRRPNPQPARATGFPQRGILVLKVAHLAKGSHAIHVDLPYLPRRELEQGPVFLLRHQLSRSPRTPTDLSPLALPELDVMDDRPHRDQPETKGVSHIELRLRAGHYLRPDFESIRGQDVALLTIRVMEQGDPG